MWVIEDNGYDSVLVRLEDDNPQPEEQEQLELFTTEDQFFENISY